MALLLAWRGSHFGCMNFYETSNGGCSSFHSGSHSRIYGGYEIIFPYNAKADAPGQLPLQENKEAIPGRRRAAC